MQFREAFWDSTLPNETISDIQRLRKGVDSVIRQNLSPGTGISLGAMQEAEQGDRTATARQDVV